MFQIENALRGNIKKHALCLIPAIHSLDPLGGSLKTIPFDHHAQRVIPCSFAAGGFNFDGENRGSLPALKN